MMRYDALLCDADDTLFDFAAAEKNAFAEACAQTGFEATPAMLEQYSDINRALWQKLEQGEITQRVLRVRRFEQFLEAIGRRDSAREMADRYAEALSRQSILLPGALEALRSWSALVPVVIVTNGISRIQHGRMDRSELRPYIRGMVVSEEVGTAKPDPRMIELGMQAAGITDRSRVLMLGDSLSSDIAAAAHAHVDACWLNPEGKPNSRGLPVAYEIRSLGEVEALLKGGEEQG